MTSERTTCRWARNALVLAGLLVGVKAAIAEPEPLVLTGFQAPPYLYNDEDGSPKGILVDVIRSASGITGVPVDIVVTNWPRAQLEVKQGRADLIFPVVYTPEREDWLHYPEKPITQFEMAIFTRPNPGFEFNGETEQLHGLTIGKIANGRMHPKFRALEESVKATIEGRDGLKQLISGTHHGRLDAFVAPRLMTMWTANKYDLETVQSFPDPIGVSNIYIGMSKKSRKKQDWDKLRAALSDLDKHKTLFVNASQNDP